MNDIRLSLTITNKNNQKAHKILLRKFFNMGFISQNGKMLHIYTAIAYGGLKEIDTDNPKCFSNENYKFTLNYKWECENKDVSAEIDYMDYTEALLKQWEKLKIVWGDDGCEEIKSQEDLSKKIEELFGQNIEVKDFDINITDKLPKRRIIIYIKSIIHKMLRIFQSIMD